MSSKLVPLAALFAATAQADTTVGADTYNSQPLRRGSTTVATINPATPDACHVRAQQDAEARRASAAYTCGSLTFEVTYQAAPPPPPPPPPPTPPPAGAYSTTFNLTEYPISEGGRWRKANNPWTYVRTANGTAYGTNGVTNTYDDSYALIGGFGVNYTVVAHVKRNVEGPCPSTCEGQILLRGSDDTNNARVLEVNFFGDGGIEMTRWNGPVGSYTGMNIWQCMPWQPAPPALKTGDILKASVFGNRFKAWVNDVMVACMDDPTMATGDPGISFFVRPGVPNNTITFDSVTITPN
jgi:hypothetical protein